MVAFRAAILTARGKLVDAVVNAVEHYNEIKPQLLTTGGTSDGRFIARMGRRWWNSGRSMPLFIKLMNV